MWILKLDSVPIVAWSSHASVPRSCRLEKNFALTILGAIVAIIILVALVILFLLLRDTSEPQQEQPTPSSVLELPSVAEAHGLTNYDAAYFALAMRFNLPLATNDSLLRKVSAAGGVTILPA
jgi:hypothetical protein